MADSPLVSSGNQEDRRSEPRWQEKKLLVLRTAADECPGTTGDISASGMRLTLPRCSATVGEAVQAMIAFPQDVVEVRGEVVYTRPAGSSTLAGIRYTPGQDGLLRFLARRYPQLQQAAPTA